MNVFVVFVYWMARHGVAQQPSLIWAQIEPQDDAFMANLNIKGGTNSVVITNISGGHTLTSKDTSILRKCLFMIMTAFKPTAVSAAAAGKIRLCV